MVIDDLADRAHDCDLLLDQNLGRLVADYAMLVNKDCFLVLGPEYALLRPEFAALRGYSLKRRQPFSLGRIMVSMGGIDRRNVASRILSGLKRSRLPTDCHITVVVGVSSCHLETLRQEAAELGWSCDIEVDVANIAHLMAESDIAIGAAGGTSWERCCLGLPTVAVVLADNQRQSAMALRAHGAAYLLPEEDGLAHNIPTAIDVLSAPERLSSMSECAANICDGRGLERVIRNIIRNV